MPDHCSVVCGLSLSAKIKIQRERNLVTCLSWLFGRRIKGSQPSLARATRGSERPALQGGAEVPGCLSRPTPWAHLCPSPSRAVHVSHHTSRTQRGFQVSCFSICVHLKTAVPVARRRALVSPWGTCCPPPLARSLSGTRPHMRSHP